MRKATLRTAGPTLAVLLLSGAGALAAQQTPTPTPLRSVTLDQAVQLTLEHSPTMVQAQGTVRTTTASERTAIGAFLPSVNASSGTSLASAKRFNSATNTLTDGSSRSYTWALSASLPIFSGGQRVADLKAARAENAAADANLIQQQFAVTLTAKTTFFNVLRDGELVRVAQAQLQEAQEALDAANMRLKVGSATRSDVLRAQLSLNQAKQAVLQAQTSEASAQYALGRLVGAKEPVGATAPPTPEPQPLAVAEADLPSLVEAQAPTVVSAQAQVKSATASITAARAQYFPAARLSTGTNWLNDVASLGGGNKSWNVGLSVSLPIFNGFQREASVETANVGADNARAQLADARLNARATLEADLASLKQTAQQLSLTQEAVQVAEEDLRVQTERYRLGAGTMLDRLTSEAALVQAQTNAVNARYDYQIARAQLEALVGRAL